MTKISTNIFFSFLAELSLFAFSFILGVLTARYLGADGKGRFWLIFNVAGILPLIFSMRFQRSLTYHLSKNKEMLGEIILYGLLVGIGTALLTALVVACFQGFFNGVVLKNINITRAVLVLLCFSRYLWSFIIALIEGLLLFKAKVFFMGGTYFLKTMEVFVALALLKLTFDDLILWMGLIETAVYAVIIFAIMLKARNYRLNLSRFLAMMKYSVESFPGMVSDLVTLRIDTFFVNYFSGPAQVGIYTVAVSLASMLTYIPTAVRNVLMPFIASYSDKEITAKLSRLLVLVMGFLCILIIPLVWVVVIPVYGAEFAFARILFLILLPGMVFWGVFTLLASDIEGRGLPWRVSKVSLISALATMGLDLLFVPLWNSMGAAIVSSMTHGLAMYLAARLYFHIMGTKTGYSLLPHREDLRLFSQIIQHALIRVRRTLTGLTSGQV